jgi:hypothetical protein
MQHQYQKRTFLKPNVSRYTPLLYSFILLLNPMQSFAENLGVTTPRITAMGQAGIGGSRANSALVLNPAGMSASAFYAIDANYFRSAEGVNRLGINIVDSQLRYTRDKIALGIGYQTQLKSGETSSHDALIGISKAISKIGGALILAGISTRYIYDEPSGRDGFNVNAGLMLQLSSIFSIGAVGADLLEESYRNAGVGIGLNTQRLSLNIDYLRQLQNADQQYRLGAEAMLSDSIVIRAGYLHNQSSIEEKADSLLQTYRFTNSQWSVGFALLPQISSAKTGSQLSFSYSRPIEGNDFFFGLSLTTYLSMNNG